MRTRDAGIHRVHIEVGQSGCRSGSGYPASRILWLGMLGLLALFIAVAAQASVASVASAQGAQPARTSTALRPAHALPVRTDPTADAILKAPPSQVKIWFDEAINPNASRIVVVDPSNHEVDARNSQVDGSGQTEMTVGLQLLRPGAYIVVWRAESLDDGHVTGSSFLFRVANADGSVPPIPATLPSGNVPGAAGFGSSSQTVDGPTLAQALGDWLALLFTLFWVGGVIWEVWVLPAQRAPTPTVALGSRLAVLRFQRLAPYALVGALLADGIMALALTAEVAGAWSGVFAAQYWQATLFSGSFGAYWWMRQGTLLVALVIALLTLRSARRDATADSLTPALDAARTADHESMELAEEPIPSWVHVALETLRQTPRLPLRLARGWLDLTPLRQAEVALGALLLFAFAMSGHAAATPPNERAYAVGVDFAHLIFSSVWLGGLLYISVVLIPAARALPERTRAMLLARGAPEFGAIAIVSAAALALTGSLNAQVRLTSLAQFATTAYGRTLFVKIELFLIMVAISAFHAFWLRPRLTRSLARSSQTRLPELRDVAGVGAQQAGPSRVRAAEALRAGDAVESDDSGHLAQPRGASASGDAMIRAAQNGHSPHENDAMNAEMSGETRRLRTRMEDWLRREALLGVGVLLCVALLALFAGSLTPTQAAAPTTSGGAFKQTHAVSGYQITLQVAPATFGQNTFTITLADAQGKPVSGASALVMTQDLDMDMGEQTLQLQPAGAASPGVYSGKGDLAMAGDWSLAVKVLPPGGKAFLTTTYKLVVGS